jgi:AbrB family looped-hinge helix DNA binding protein
MSITITLGKAGRLVVPKAIRESLGLREGTRLRLESSAGKFEAIPEPDDVQISVRDGFPVISGGRPRKKGDIVKAIKAGREERTDRILAHRRKK